MIMVDGVRRKRSRDGFNPIFQGIGFVRVNMGDRLMRVPKANRSRDSIRRGYSAFEIKLGHFLAQLDLGAL
jgi:hypothetical protein